ncbi:MAG TPA: AAA family ATPase, partial [Candidatus Sulfotelmatobacter sp.]|nr:AAA family ATPase [Candidatus Sulfotelmatobacter sp.]
MKLEAIEISGFGRLREVTVDFSPRFTVLVGDNESGKSTVQRAVRAALYGIDAGGQGRAVERSEWHRWMPWSPGPYAVALRYALDDGRRLRVTRRLEQREQEVQVLELGAKDITAQLRIGRIVAPARFHLGIDEAVFCATACLAEDALQLGSPDGLPQRADRVREAIERLVDSGRGVNAAAALARIEEAINRVGSERRVTTPLGAATARLRQLDTELESARRRSAVVSAEQRRLVELERIATSDEARCLDLEKAWLRERLAGIAIQVSELDTAEREEEALSAELHELERFARFPLHNEERVISLSGEVQQCAANAERAEQAWRAAQSELAGVRTRRREIANTIDALAAP